jgi:phosphate transport system substrate-binding protein
MASGAHPSTIRAAALIAGLLWSAPALGEEVLRITGTGSALGMAAQLAPAFERANPGVKIRILPSLGSSGAVKAVAGGALDLGLSGRPLQPKEAAEGLTAVEVARTPYLFAVGPRSTATHLDAGALVRILRGELTTWPDGERVRLVLRPASDVDTTYLRSRSPALAAAMDLALTRPGMLMAATNQECDELVARTPGALGLSTLAQLRTEPRGLKALAWEGVEPSLATLADGTYPLWKPFYAVLPASPSPASRRFLAFLASPAGKRLLEEAGCQPPPFRTGG